MLTQEHPGMMASEDEAAVACVGLSKRYDGRTLALDHLTLTIPRGTGFGLLGENGAGKTTLVRLLMGFIFPTAGTVRVLGEPDVARAHPRVGYLHERPAFEMQLTARQYLITLAELAGLRGAAGRWRVDEVLDQLHLQRAADRRIGTFSRGMLQRLGIAQALLTDPDLLILDEPTSGLDPGGQWEVRQAIAQLRAQGKTMLLCSHYLAEVEALCDTVGILRRGRLVRSGAVADLLRTEDRVEIILAADEPASAVAVRLNMAGQVIAADGAALHIRAADQPRVLAALLAGEVPIRALNPVVQTLEDLYMRATRPGVRTDGLGPAGPSTPAPGGTQQSGCRAPQ
jgi:ABC-2 type transport system ATP-binding protein